MTPFAEAAHIADLIGELRDPVCPSGHTFHCAHDEKRQREAADALDALTNDVRVERARVVHEPSSGAHSCDPGGDWAWMDERPSGIMEGHSWPAGTYWVESDLTRYGECGTVVECECGKTWVLESTGWRESSTSVFAPQRFWREETRRQRRKRERTAARS